MAHHTSCNAATAGGVLSWPGPSDIRAASNIRAARCSCDNGRRASAVKKSRSIFLGQAKLVSAASCAKKVVPRTPVACRINRR